MKSLRDPGLGLSIMPPSPYNNFGPDLGWPQVLPEISTTVPAGGGYVPNVISTVRPEILPAYPGPVPGAPKPTPQWFYWVAGLVGAFLLLNLMQGNQGRGRVW